MELIEIKKEINKQIGNKETFNTLVATTFKGLEVSNVKRAILEGMMRGFEFKDFLEKNVYAVPFSGSYSLVTSIDYARKIGMRSGIVGKSAPKFVDDKDGKIVSCEVTVKRKVDDTIGEYSSLVYFSEYNTGRNLWKNKPRTMIAKVAEMHALRMACPEELQKAYIEEEYQKEAETPQEAIDLIPFKEKLEAVKDEEELKKVWSGLPIEAKNGLVETKDELKKKYATTKISGKGAVAKSKESQDHGK